MTNFSAFTNIYFTNLEENISEETTIAANDRTTFTRGKDYVGLVLGTTIIILVIVTNFASLLAFVVEKRLRTYNNYFIINLAVSDFLVGVNQIIGVVHTFLGYFPLNQDGCKVYLGIRNALFSVSVIGVVVICIDRHRATYDPINHFMRKSKGKAVLLNALTWIIAFGFWMSYATIWDFAVNADSGRFCVATFSRNAIADIVQNVLTFFIPLFIISVLYVRIYIKIKHSIRGKNVSKKFQGDIDCGASVISTISSTVTSTVVSEVVIEMKASNEPTQDKKHDVQTNINRNSGKGKNRESVNEMKKATRTLSYIVLSFIVAWLPNNIIYLLFAIDPGLILTDSLPLQLRQTFNWLRYANSFLNPICYAMSQPLFRKTILNLFTNPGLYC